MAIILGYFFLFLHKNICYGYSLEAPCRGASNEYTQHMFLWRTVENYPVIVTNYSSLSSPLNKYYLSCAFSIVFQNVVGWYSFRRGSTMRPSFRERLLHENLSQCVTVENPAEFTFLLCTSKFTANLSTHTFDHGFMKINNK